MHPIKILIADDHKIFREGLNELLSKELDLKIIGNASHANEIIDIVRKESPDLILMDIDMGDTSGIDMTAEVRRQFPRTKVLALSMHGEKNYIVRILEAGANGYILKNAGKEEIVAAIHTVTEGGTYFSSQVSSKLLEHLVDPIKQKKRTNGQVSLTERETEILKLIAEEYSNPEIAERLFISVRTVDTHRRNLLEKLGVKNTAGLVKYAIKIGLLDT